MDFIETFEGDRATQYENKIGKMIPFYSGVAELVASSLIDSIPQGKKILAAGCGTGADFGALMKVAPDRYRITGVDPSPEMIEQAKKKFPNAELICSPVSGLEKSLLFSGATLLFVLHFLPDDVAKLSLLKDISSRLEPNGKFILFDIYDSNEDMDSVFKDVAGYLRTFQGWDDSALETYLNRVKTLNKIPPKRYAELFKEAGFIKWKQIFQAHYVGGWIAFR
ncbi:class I SAM-dependent methyltransferase [Leptospira stimsonii]|uniref:Class I SAM-dependent methyltransferase n=1 Tax=Leptospira stimsonii TaxID=2202203 RepID=A0ABY2NAW3_9LEPT|nr:class I SAM-dependent methyltransferase [Leptospira stimsonii]TGK10844.1 class I SAM-dependent methyltransferase [Leptospira stimsonii]TGM20337.1 class I SAM-dependent methyltransferase [Leptospira stimsonii]